ncbi:carbamate kinase [Salipaludibacillus aurantiacus]|nr:carbamate kinase [Salipaludibacillus aurantiacus]
MNTSRIVVALGGNAIQSGDATAASQQKALKSTAKQLTSLVEAGHEVVLSHGNGPQVGNVLIQQAEADSLATPAMPLDTCGAMTQGMIGYWMQNAFTDVFFERNINKGVVTVVTRVLVDEKDPSFQNPTKPIGPFYTEEEVIARQASDPDAHYKEDAGRGWRRAVASPRPKAVLEASAIQELLSAGELVISGGGGGVPVILKNGRLQGVEAVIDKDFASEMIAEMVDADILMILTAVDQVSLNFNSPDEIKLKEMTIQDCEDYINNGHFAPGSMLPKIEAATAFVRSKPGRKAIIASLHDIDLALQGHSGTLIYDAKDVVTPIR